MRMKAPSVPPKYGAAPPEDDVNTLKVTATAVPSVGAGLRKKPTGFRPWLQLDSTGQAQVVEAGKHAIMRRTGLPARDLRILDPLLSYPSTVLGRERAIVINLEHIKAIITAQEALLLNSRDPIVNPFVEELQRRILRHHHVKSLEVGANVGDVEWTNLFDLEEQRSRTYSPPPRYSGSISCKDEEGKTDEKQQMQNMEMGRSCFHLSLLLWRRALRLLAVS